MVAFSMAGRSCCQAGAQAARKGATAWHLSAACSTSRSHSSPALTMSSVQGGVHMTSVDKIEDLAKQMLGGTLVTKQTGAAG